MTPILKAIEYAKKNAGFISDEDSKEDKFARMAYRDMIEYLYSLLQTEKEWAEKVWEGGAEELLESMTSRGLPKNKPDFNTFYSQYTEDKSILNQTK